MLTFSSASYTLRYFSLIKFFFTLTSHPTHVPLIPSFMLISFSYVPHTIFHFRVFFLYFFLFTLSPFTFIFKLHTWRNAYSPSLYFPIFHCLYATYMCHLNCSSVSHHHSCVYQVKLKMMIGFDPFEVGRRRRACFKEIFFGFWIFWIK